MPVDEIHSSDEQAERKSAAAFRTIGEVSEELGIPQHVLRFWEKRFNQLEPMKRRGRRYYRPEDIELLKHINNLLYKEGYTIKGVQNYLLHSNSGQTTGQGQPDLFGGKGEGDIIEKPRSSKVKHNAGGIPRQKLEKILEKLHTANATLKRAVEQ